VLDAIAKRYAASRGPRRRIDLVGSSPTEPLNVGPPGAASRLSTRVAAG
jgi:hypothetical protein